MKLENLILNTPTGSGKSLVAEALVFFSLSQQRRVVLTYPIKALANEKFRRLRSLFGDQSVGLATGDISENSSAPVLVCTAEILGQMALSNDLSDQPDDVIVDEFHYYSDRDRGHWWQIPLLLLDRTRFVVMSATLGDPERFQNVLTELNGYPTQIVSGLERPVPLTFEYRSQTALHETLKDLVDSNRAPVYLVSFSQADAFEEAQNLTSIDLISKDKKRDIAERLKRATLRSPQGKLLNRYLRHGIGVHHAGLLPQYRMLVEELAQSGLLAVISGTDTLGVGVNVPIRTVLLTGLAKYDGQKTAILSVRDFNQIVGRAGRRGFDTEGFVVAQDPPHEIENRKLKQKALGDPKKAKKLVLVKPPDRGFVPWNEQTFERLKTAPSERLDSQFRIDFSMVLLALRSGPLEAKRRLKLLLKKNHDRDRTDAKKRRRGHIRRLFQILRHLKEKNLITLSPLKLSPELQRDFSLHQSLSSWLVDAVHDLFQKSEGREDRSGDKTLEFQEALDVLSVCESVVESPDVILNRQRSRARNTLFQQLKAEGLERDEIMDRLDEVDHPKPLADWIYPHFNAWQALHPWIGADNVRPKSIAREMLETGMNFSDFVREYGIERFEGVLYRYLKSFLQVVRQNLPPELQSDAVLEFRAILESELSFIDQELRSEWMKTNQDQPASASVINSKASSSAQLESIDRSGREQEKRDQLNRERSLRVRVFQFVQPWSRGDFDLATEVLMDALNPSPNDALKLGVSLDGSVEACYWFERESLSPGSLQELAERVLDGPNRLRLNPEARSSANGEWIEKTLYRHWLIDDAENERIASVLAQIGPMQTER